MEHSTLPKFDMELGQWGVMRSRWNDLNQGYLCPIPGMATHQNHQIPNETSPLRQADYHGEKKNIEKIFGNDLPLWFSSQVGSQKEPTRDSFVDDAAMPIMIILISHIKCQLSFKPKKSSIFFSCQSMVKAAPCRACPQFWAPSWSHATSVLAASQRSELPSGQQVHLGWFSDRKCSKNSVFWCFSNGLFDGVLTIFLEGLMFLRFSLMVLFMVDGFWLFVWRVFGLLALMVLRWFLMVSAIPVWGLLCTHRSIHLGLINWNNLPCVSIHTSSTSAK